MVDNLTALVPRNVLEQRHQWPTIARDLVLTKLPQSGAVISEKDICDNYNITTEELAFLKELPEFLSFYEKEVKEARDLGHKAAHIYRAEAMATRVGEAIFNRVINNSCEVKDSIRFYELLLKTAQLDKVDGTDQSQANSTMVPVININIPNLTNSKLDHIVSNRVIEVGEIDE